MTVSLGPVLTTETDDEFLGLGPIELLIILIVALLVVGPEKLLELGALVGRFILDFRRVSDEVKSAFSDALVEPRPTWNGSSTAAPPAASQAYVSAPPSMTTESEEDDEGEPEARPLAESYLSEDDEQPSEPADDSPERR
jgi:Sec-independent protein translocase protein TatA